MSDTLGAWAARLQPASWRGVPFKVQSSTIRRGRRVAVHEYPFRDDVWVEDLGRGTRTVAFTGYLIGNDVFDQRDAMAKAAEEEGKGQLVHPSLGSFDASLTDFSAGERWDLGRVVQIEFAFIQTGKDSPLYPTTDVATQASVVGAAGGLFSASSGDFLSGITADLRSGISVVQGVVHTVTGFVAQVVGTVRAVAMVVRQVIALPGLVIGSVLGGVGQVIGLIDDAALSAKATVGLIGNFGRYALGGRTDALPASATVQSCLAALSANRTAVNAAAATVMTSAATAQTALPAAVQTAIEGLRTAIPDPVDQLRLLAVLAGYRPAAPPASSAPIGAAVASAQQATAALIRRTACASLAIAVSNYQPSSYDAALQALDTVSEPLTTEMIGAADAGDKASYQALRTLLTAVSRDLLTRGATLPRLMQVHRAAPLPSLVLAYQLYRDATRSDELVARADAIHPLFMPTDFTALSR